MSQSFYDLLDVEQQEFLNLYKSNGPYLWGNFFANDLNKMLCEGNSNPDWHSAIDVLDSITTRHVLPEEAILYRVTSEELFLRYIEPVVIPYPAFMSTSCD